jgi:AsmA protein
MLEKCSRKILFQLSNWFIPLKMKLEMLSLTVCSVFGFNQMRKFFLVSASILIGIVLLILVVPSIFKSQIADTIQHELNSNLHADVNFSEADINLWRNFPQFTATFSDFSIAGKHEFTGDTLVRARGLHLVLSSVKLLLNEGIEVKHLSLDEPEIYISILHSGKANFDISLEDPSDTAANVVLNIEGWDISKGTLLYEDERNGFHFETNDVDLSGMFRIEGPVTNFALSGDSHALGIMQNNDRVVRDKTVSWRLAGIYNAKVDSLSFKQSTLRINNLDLAFAGSFAFRRDGVGVDLKVKSEEAEFKDILSLSQSVFRDFSRMDIKGRMSLEAQFLGLYNSKEDIFPAFKANLIVNDGSIKYHSLPSSLNQINFDLAAFNLDGNLENTTVNLQYVGMYIGENPVYGSAQIQGFKDGALTADLLAKIPLADLAKIYPMEGLGLGGNLDVELKANGRFSGRLSELGTADGLRHERVPPFHLGVKLTDGSVRYSHLVDTIRDMNLDLTIDNKTGLLENTEINIQRIQAFFGDNPIKGQMFLNGITEPLMRGSLNASINLDEIKDFYPIENLTLKGLVDLDLNVDGKLSEAAKLFPRVSAKLRVNNAFIQSGLYPAPMENTHLVMQALNETGKFADTRFIIDTLTYSIENESFTVNGWVHDLEKYNYDLDIKGVLYLEKIQKIFSMENLVMRGEVDIDLKASGNLGDLRAGRYHRLPAEGQLRMKEVFFRNEALSSGLSVKDAHLFFSNEKIFLDTLHGSLGESKFSLTGHFNNYFAFVFRNGEPVKGDLLFESENFDINELLREKKEKRDTVHHDLQAIGVPLNIDFTFDSKIKRLSYKSLECRNFIGEVIVRNGVIQLNNTTFNALDADFRISGDYDPRNIRHPLFDLDVSVHQLNITKAHEAFVTVKAIAPAAENTNGIFSVDYKLTGELTQSMTPVFDSLKGSGTIRISDAKINGMKLFHHISGLTKKEELMNPNLKDIVMDIDVEKGVINVRPFTMKLAGFDTEIAGKHELTGSMNYILKIALPPFDLVKIPLHVDGTYDNPRVHVGKGHEESLKKVLGQNNL